MESLKYFPFDKLEEMKYNILHQIIDSLFFGAVIFIVVIIIMLFSDDGK